MELKELREKERGKGKGGRGRGKGKRTMGLDEDIAMMEDVICLYEEDLERVEEKMQEMRGKQVTGTINDATIDKLQRYYGNAIRAHPNNLSEMKEACLAVHYHSVSTDNFPQHDHCPVGGGSWCKYQKALANHQDVPPHRPTIPRDFGPFAEPIIKDLCKEELLKKCLLGATQNRNESFNALVWACAPKTEYCSHVTVQIAVSHAALVFNSGKGALTKVMGTFGLHPGPLCTAHLARQDALRVSRSRTKEAEVAKSRRKSKRNMEIRVEEARIAEEGVTYEAGGEFD